MVAGLVGHAGAALLVELADRLGLPAELDRWAGRGQPGRARHRAGKVVTDLAVMLADGGDCLSDLATLRDQPGLFGPVASTPTAWRVIERLAQADEPALAGLRLARARTRRRAWQAGAWVDGLLVIALDATVVTAHSDKQSAAGTYKGGFGFHPLAAWLDRGNGTGEAVCSLGRRWSVYRRTCGSDLERGLTAGQNCLTQCLIRRWTAGERTAVRCWAVGRVREEECEMELLPKRGFELIPKRGDDEAAAEIDVPFQLNLDDGDRILTTITKSGTVEIRAVEPDKMFVLGTVIIDGFAPEEAQAIAKGFWGRVWAGIKAAVRAVMEAITFDGGPYLGTCRADVQVTHVDGVPVGGTVGIKCTQ